MKDGEEEDENKKLEVKINGRLAKRGIVWKCIISHMIVVMTTVMIQQLCTQVCIL